MFSEREREFMQAMAYLGTGLGAMEVGAKTVKGIGERLKDEGLVDHANVVLAEIEALRSHANEVVIPEGIEGAKAA